MPDTPEKSPRIVIPRRSVLAGSAALIGGLSALPAWSQSSGEGGEGGEGASASGLEGPVEFLYELGLFEATVRIVSTLYAEDQADTAREHLEQSHHASYEDIEHEVEEYGATPFEEEAEAFADAVREGASKDAVKGAAETVLAAIAAAQSGIDPHEQVEAVEALMKTAYDDYEAGVAEGVVDAPQEYRDAWGFVAVATARLDSLAASGDADVAKAGAAARAALDPAAPLFPSITAAEVPGADASILAGAAARIEIAGMRLK